MQRIRSFVCHGLLGRNIAFVYSTVSQTFSTMQHHCASCYLDNYDQLIICNEKCHMGFIDCKLNNLIAWLLICHASFPCVHSYYDYTKNQIICQSWLAWEEYYIYIFGCIAYIFYHTTSLCQLLLG